MVIPMRWSIHIPFTNTSFNEQCLQNKFINLWRDWIEWRKVTCQRFSWNKSSLCRKKERKKIWKMSFDVKLIVKSAAGKKFVSYFSSTMDPLIKVINNEFCVQIQLLKQKHRNLKRQFRFLLKRNCISWTLKFMFV